jgi:hypothetical protein
MAGLPGGTLSRILNKLQYALANDRDHNGASAIGTVATTDRVPVADASDDYEIKYATPAELLAGAGVTATVAEINSAADVSSGIVSIPDATTYTVLAANSGKTHVIAELAADCTIDLPAAAAGLEYTFIMGGVATEGQNWIFDSMSATNYYTGGLQFLDSDEPGSGSTLVPVYPDGNSNDIMTIITPQAGTYVHVICDGTLWIVNGVVFSATAPTFAD